jgi:hypothetical protein
MRFRVDIRHQTHSKQKVGIGSEGDMTDRRLDACFALESESSSHPGVLPPAMTSSSPIHHACFNRAQVTGLYEADELSWVIRSA